MADSHTLLTAEELQALYRRLDHLLDEVAEMQKTVSRALAENRQRDQQRVTPEKQVARRTRTKTSG